MPWAECLWRRGRHAFAIPTSDVGRHSGARERQVAEAWKKNDTLDLTMPVMDGTAFLEWKESDPAYASVPVIITSGDRPEKILAAQREHDVVEALCKPVDLDRLLAAIETHCQRIGRTCSTARAA